MVLLPEFENLLPEFGPGIPDFQARRKMRSRWGVMGGMRWVALIAFGVFGWMVSSGAIEIRIWAAPWLHGWKWAAWCVTLALCGLASIPLFVAVFEPACQCFGNWMENLSDDAERISERYCGKKKGWIYQAIKWSAILLILPFALAFGTILNGES